MLKRIERDEVIDAVYQGKLVYLMVPANAATTLNALFTAAGYLVEVRDDERFPAEPEQWTEADDEEDEKPDEPEDENAEEIAENPEEEDEPEDEPNENEDEPAPAQGEKSAVHQKIVNMYLAGRTIKYIAQELGKSAGTVHYHLRKEGLV